MPVLILARGLQGLGGGGIMPTVQTVISDVVTPRERGQYQAYLSGVWVAAGIGGTFPTRGYCHPLLPSCIYFYHLHPPTRDHVRAPPLDDTTLESSPTPH